MANCPQCNRPGRDVSPLAVAHNLISTTELPCEDGWELCLSGSECNVVYFHDATVLEKSQLRALPYHKGDDEGRLVCFCFGHTVSAIAREVNLTGGSTLQVAIRDACRRGETDCERLNPQGRCCLGNIAGVIEEERKRGSAGHSGGCTESSDASSLPGRTHRREAMLCADPGFLTRRAASREPLCVFTCYDALTAHWMARGGAELLLVGDSAGTIVLGMDATERPSAAFMSTIARAVKRSAPSAYVIVDYPDELSGDCQVDALKIRGLYAESGADAVKVESSADSLRAVLGSSVLQEVAVIAHIRADDAMPRCCGRKPVAAPVAPTGVGDLGDDMLVLADAGATAILLESLPHETAMVAYSRLKKSHPDLPVLGCNVDAELDGIVEMSHELLGLAKTSKTGTGLGVAIRETVRQRIEGLRR